MIGPTFTLDRAPLLAALTATAKVVERRNTMPILDNVLIEADLESITITATDLDIQIATRMPAEVREAGATTLRAQQLFELVKRLPEAARITLQPAEGGQMSLTAGRTKAKLPSRPAADYPNIGAEYDGGEGFEITGKALLPLLARTAHAISSEETRYYLNGTHLRAKERGSDRLLQATATDGHRLARVETAEAGGLSLPSAGVIVPRKAVEQIARLAERAGDAPLHVRGTPSKLAVTQGETHFVTKLIDGTFPDCDRVIPRDNPKRLRVATAELKSAIDRMLVLAIDKDRAIKLSITAERIEITARSPDAGSMAEEIEGEFEGEPIDIGFNGRLVVDTLNQVGADTVLMRFADPGSPCLVQARDDDPGLFVLMPCRV